MALFPFGYPVLLDVAVVSWLAEGARIRTVRDRKDAMGKHSGEESDDKLTKQQSDGDSGSRHGSGQER
jgi:hypothetical protein